ncbi:MAG: 30S ribosomal protein S6 [Deltaproteobacteria bacterium]|nr:30S ribosomal protein S6 [Deltaproteobacteria bacterium]
MVREYETLYVVSPELDKSGIDNLNNKFKNIIQENGGKVIKLTRWGKRDLAYRIKKYTHGYYIHLNYFGEGRTVNELQRNLRLNENILRYITIKLSDEADINSKESQPDSDLEVKKVDTQSSKDKEREIEEKEGEIEKDGGSK